MALSIMSRTRTTSLNRSTSSHKHGAQLMLAKWKSYQYLLMASACLTASWGLYTNAETFKRIKGLMESLFLWWHHYEACLCHSCRQVRTPEGSLMHRCWDVITGEVIEVRPVYYTTSYRAAPGEIKLLPGLVTSLSQASDESTQTRLQVSGL